VFDCIGRVRKVLTIVATRRWEEVCLVPV
jgi:hypothetical protein